MGIKKIARPMNKAKNEFIKWLKYKEAEDIEEFEGNPSNCWDYYRNVDAFVDEKLYSVSFTIWRGKECIEYSDEENRYNYMSIDEFMQLIS